MQYIADVNVFLPILADGHSHRIPAIHWWESCDDASIGLCLPVHLALLRLLSNVRVMGSNLLHPKRAWNVVMQLVNDPRVIKIEQIPPTHAQHWHTHVMNREPSPNLWADAWLAALAQSCKCEMVTFDRGFQSFANLHLRLLQGL